MAALLFLLLAQFGDDPPPLPDLLAIDTTSVAEGVTALAPASRRSSCEPTCGSGSACVPSDRGPVCVAEGVLRSEAPTLRMGLSGQWVIDSGFNLDLVHAWRSGSASKVTEIRLYPAASYFFIDHLALHLGLGLQLTLVPNAGTVLGVSGKLGLRYYLELGPQFGLWPGIDAEFAQVQASSRNQTEGRFGFAASAQVPLLIHVAPPAFLGLGPKFDWFWSNDAGLLKLGLAFLLGFYL